MSLRVQLTRSNRSRVVQHDTAPPHPRPVADWLAAQEAVAC
jgi:hypothetical protein